MAKKDLIEEVNSTDEVVANVGAPDTDVDDKVAEETPTPEEVTDDGVFADFIGKLRDSQGKIETLKKATDKIIKNKKLTPEQKQAKYMELFNAAILSFLRLPHELDRLCKAQKQLLWQNKERTLKQIY